MQLPVVFLTLVVGSSLAGFISKVSNGNRTSRLVETAAKVLKSCYGNRGNAVGLANDANGTLIRTFFQQSIPVALIDSASETSRNGSVEGKSRYRLQVFVVVASTSTELKEILKQFKDSIWWNHLASFVILNWPPESNHECSNAYKMLWSAWEVDLLNAKFMCLHPKQGHLIYGYNPYTNKAPDLWELRETHIGKNDHPWTLFARRFQDDEQICEELDFDKTKDLGGYEIPANVLPESLSNVFSVDPNKTGIEGFGGSIGNVARILCGALNGTCKLFMFSPKSTVDKNTNDNLLNTEFNGISDIAFVPKFLLTSVNTTTYPYWQSGIGVVTQYSGYKSQLSKIKHVIDRPSRYGVCLVFFVTLGFFKFCLRQSLTSAFLNNIRIVCNGGILNVPQNQAARIYLAGLFIFALTVLALYQGQLASLLTKPVSLPNVNTMEDLINSHHTIYGFKTFASYFRDPVFEGRYIKLEDFACIPEVLNDSSAACVGERQFFINVAMENNLHLSSHTVSKDYWIYPIRSDWPLERRVNVIISRLIEAAIIRHWFMKDIQETTDRFHYMAKLKDEQKFEVMTLSELGFAFAILGIGLSFATAVFIVEVGVSWGRFKITLFK